MMRREFRTDLVHRAADTIPTALVRARRAPTGDALVSSKALALASLAVAQALIRTLHVVVTFIQALALASSFLAHWPGLEEGVAILNIIKVGWVVACDVCRARDRAIQIIRTAQIPNDKVRSTNLQQYFAEDCKFPLTHVRPRSSRSTFLAKRPNTFFK